MSDKHSLQEFEKPSKKSWHEKISIDLKGKEISSLIWHSPNAEAHPFLTLEDREEVLATTGPNAFRWATGKNSNNWNVELLLNSHSNIENGLLDGVDSVFVKGKIATDLSTKDVTISTEDMGTIAGDQFRSLSVCADVDDHPSNIELYLNDITDGGRLEISACSLANKGTSAVLELGLVLSKAHDYLAHATDNQRSSLSTTMAMRLTVDSSFFVNLAKFRVIRTLWCTIAAAYNLDGSIEIVAETSKWNKAGIDTDTNLLRSTTEAMSALLGGVDKLLVHGHEDDDQKSSTANRLARNIQLMLKNESFLDRVADPAGGSYYVEDISCQMADKAWGIFKDIEAQGGFFSALASGFIDQLIEQSAKNQLEALQNGERTMIGVNAFHSSRQELAIRQMEGRLASTMEHELISKAKES